MIYWLRFLYRRDISVQSLHCTLVHLEFYCSVIRRNEINEIGRNRVIFSVVFHRRNLFWLLISYFDHWRKLSCIAITKVACHFTANRCCETFPDCCENFPDCCETFPVCCEICPETNLEKPWRHSKKILLSPTATQLKHENDRFDLDPDSELRSKL